MSGFQHTGVMCAAIFLIGLALGWWLNETGIERDMIVGGVEEVLITEGPISFTARLDSGATVSSINARRIEVVDGDPEDATANLGKVARFTLANAKGDEVTLEAPIKLVKPVNTADCREWRYHVYLNIEFRDRRHRVLVNLNDRSRSSYQLLLGRNWLRYGYVVHVSQSEPTKKS